MKLKIIAVGKKHDSAFRAAIEDYQKRLQSNASIVWHIVPSAQRDNQLEQQKVESAAISRHINDSEHVVLLDEIGTELNNNRLADVMKKHSAASLCFVIGGAYGVDTTVKDRANLIWSLSPLVFPHQLVRLILVEQLYRSFSIIHNHPYHHQ